MTAEKWEFLDERLKIKLADLDDQLFEDFFLHFFNAGICLTVERNGQRITRRVITAEKYAAGSGRAQKGIDLRAEVECDGLKEVWVFQCKRVKKWNRSQTVKAIEKAAQYPAHHYFLIVACDPHEDVQDEIHKHGNWTFWNLDLICAELRLRVPPSVLPKVLFFLPPEELKRFAPFTTDALISPEKFFERFLGADRLFRHDWRLVGREKELQALHDFAAGSHKVQILTARGGEGKSRLLWEFCRTVAKEGPETEVVCLNPHRVDDFSFAFIGESSRRVVLVDDAHRTEQVPLQLLDLVRQDRVAKVVLATRPQGIEALTHKLCEAGLSESLAPPLCLASLKKRDVRSLALEVLGEPLGKHAGALAELTGDNPFLTVIAGGLLRGGQLEWGRWESHDEFRQQVFMEFERKNFETIPEPDRSPASGLLRMLALLAPQALDATFSERAARVLRCSTFQLETHLNRLRQSELVVGSENGLRIVPDLFADFLVYDACYGPKKTPGFVQQVLCEFDDRSPALLRNLSEATWLARVNGVADDALMRTVLTPELSRFENESFFERAQTLEHWTGFGVYLPVETLALARLALKLETAPPEENQWEQYFPRSNLNSHAHVCEQIPRLLRPIAIFHEKYRHETLDLLWNLGLRSDWGRMQWNNHDHPWSVIAQLLKYGPEKPITAIVSVLNWIDGLVRRPGTLSSLEGPNSILRLFLSPCFERFVVFTEVEGRTARWWREPVSIKATRSIRDQALAIMEWVIEHGSWLAALDALSALSTAVGRVLPWETKQVQDPTEFRARWRSERLKALSLYEKAAAKHAHVSVRYEIRRTLRSILAYEEDTLFAQECRKVLGRVPVDLALQTAVAVLSQGVYQLDEVTDGSAEIDTIDRQQELWDERVRTIASEVATAYPDAGSLGVFLGALTDELTKAGNHVVLGSLFTGLAEIAPSLAVDLASQVLEDGSRGILARDWPALVEKNRHVSDGRKTELFTMAVRRRIPDASVALIRAFTWRIRDGAALAETEGALLVEIAAKADPDEAINLLQLVAWSNDANLVWAIRILEALPIQEILSKPEFTGLLLSNLLTALVPYRRGRTSMPQATVRRVLKQLVSVAELDIGQQSREWNVLVAQYPREIFDLVRRRIAYRASVPPAECYRPVPHGYPVEFDLSALAKEPDYPTICEELWDRVSAPRSNERSDWLLLFQAIALQDDSLWVPRMLTSIEATTSEEALRWLAQLLKFEGSLIIFRFPQITRAFLERARAIGGERLYCHISIALCSGSGPQVRHYEEGILDRQSDYMEAEAIRAAEAHASDEVLGPFYRWIVKSEQQERLRIKMRIQTDSTALD